MTVQKYLSKFTAIFLMVAGSLSASTVAVADVTDAAIEDGRPGEPPAYVLFVGNSFTYYNNSLHNHYRELVRAAGREEDRPGRVRSMTISGGYLPEHTGAMPKMLESEPWDAVVLQGHSKGPISDDTGPSFRRAARDFAALIREHGAKPVFFMTWAYTDQPEMTTWLDNAYTGIGRELDALVVPVGLAFETVTRDRPEISLRTADAKHPTLAGTYLAACLFFASLDYDTPVGSTYTAGLDRDVAEYLQEVAATTVRRYQWRETRSAVGHAD